MQGKICAKKCEQNNRTKQNIGIKFLTVVFACFTTLILSMSVSLARPAQAQGASQDPAVVLHGIVDAMQNTEGGQTPDDIYKWGLMSTSTSFGDWVAFDLSRMDITGGRNHYANMLEDYVTQAYATTDQLDRTRSTEWSRIAIVANALGKDATAFGKKSDGSSINLVADGTYNWTHTSDIASQGSNAYIWALTAIHACGVEVPEDAIYPLYTLINGLLEYQNADGGFGLSKGYSDVDITAMAIVALSPHASADQTVMTAIQEGLDFLSNAQAADGSFASMGTDNCESTAQVVIALCSMHIDPRTDARFTKPQGNAYDALLSFKRSDGSFSHTQSDDLSQVEWMATEQAMRALLATEEFDSGADGNVYTVDATLAVIGASQNINLPMVIGIIAAIIVVAVVVVLVARARSRKKNAGKDAGANKVAGAGVVDSVSAANAGDADNKNAGKNKNGDKNDA